MPAPTPAPTASGRVYADKAELSAAINDCYTDGNACVSAGILDWDVSAVTDMSRLFYNKENFNGDVSSWDVSAVTDMYYMFKAHNSVGRHAFSGDLSEWDVGSVTNMQEMFYNAANFNGGNLSGWDVGSVNNMYSMFVRATSFNGDLSGWDVANVFDMHAMFYGAANFNGDISGWDVANVRDVYAMFNECANFNADLSCWDVSGVTSYHGMNYMFQSATEFNADLSGWDVGGIVAMNRMFAFATDFNADLSGWDVGSVGDMQHMFGYAASFDRNLTGWVVPHDHGSDGYRYVFDGATSFDSECSPFYAGTAPCRAPRRTLAPATCEPTSAPATSEPTASPSISPTNSVPTMSPTISQSTSDPTASPTALPTTSDPTDSPATLSPTPAPSTSEPTPSPTPTTLPTTSDPTTSPTSPITILGATAPSESNDTGITILLVCIALLAIIVGIGLFVARRRRQRQDDKGSPETAHVRNPAVMSGRGTVSVPAAPDAMADVPSSAVHEIPVSSDVEAGGGGAPSGPGDLHVVTRKVEAWMPLRQRSNSYSEAFIDTPGCGDGPAGTPWAQSQRLEGVDVTETGSSGLPTGGIDGQSTTEPDSVVSADPNDGYICTVPGPPVMPPPPQLSMTVGVSPAARPANTLTMPQDQAYTGLDGQQSTYSTSPVHATATQIAGTPESSENQYAEVVHPEVAGPVEDMYEDIAIQKFQKGALERKLGADDNGDLRLASVRRTNPLAPNVTSSAAGTKPIAPAIYEYEYAEMIDARPNPVSDQPMYDNAASSDEPLYEDVS